MRIGIFGDLSKGLEKSVIGGWSKELTGQGDWRALIEVTAELPQPPMLMFDKIKGYPAGFRLVSLPYAYSEFQL